jgi:thiol:disulfide interchange protein DsbG
MSTARRLPFFVLFLGLIWLAPVLWHAAAAQDAPGRLKGDEPPLTQGQQPPQKEPPLPAPVQTLVQQGGQVRYLGRQLGMDGWIAVRNGQVEYFYATPDGNALLMGMLFDKNGKLVTVRQVKELQEKSGGALSQFVDKPVKASPLANGPLAPPLSKFKTPSEQLYDDVSYSNWIPLGSPEAPFIYAFIDPQCPHCHDMLLEMRKAYIDKNLLQVRIVPIGFREETMLQAAYLLAAPDPQSTLFKHLEGDKTALPVTPNINIQGVQRNLAIMQSWHFDVTPIVLYRGADGRVKIVRGRVKDIPKLLADLPKNSADMTPASGTP